MEEKEELKTEDPDKDINIDITPYLDKIGGVIRENWLVILLILMMCVMFYLYQHDLAACNEHYQNIINDAARRGAGIINPVKIIRDLPPMVGSC